MVIVPVPALNAKQLSGGVAADAGWVGKLAKNTIDMAIDEIPSIFEILMSVYLEN